MILDAEMDDPAVIFWKVFLFGRLPLLYFKSTSLICTYHQGIDANFRFAFGANNLERETARQNLLFCHPDCDRNRYFYQVTTYR